ncbi:RagB/SusD family nutrient uptake outer membrane protein [Pedobacter agri]|uniref:RagB/SusD family nutrient uptake outer membrane protein n=1 Tax=Pedobacter agri TaxID=454586 RepID=UPI0029302965|nr:RagB/SusD family nutrient uptake outer membrane protein [Pedobacter agri]
MKRNLILIIATLTFASSCKKDFLEVEPIGKTVARTLNDYNNLFYNGNLLGTGFADIQIPMSDDVAAVDTYLTPASVAAQRSFKWEKDIYNEDENAVEFTSMMSQIYLMNKIINEVMNSEEGTDAAKQTLRAEARATRAWSYFMLINYYGKPYNRATSSSDPGFPIVTVADAAGNNFERASVEQVYQFIIADLVESIPLLSRNSVIRARMTKAGALGLLGKVYVFMGRYHDALNQLDQLPPNLPTTVTTEVLNYNTFMAVGGGWGYSPTVNSYTGGPLAFSSNESIFARNFLSSYMVTSNVLLLTPETIALYSANDQRKKLYTTRVTPLAANATFPAGLTRRYGFNTIGSYGINYPEYFLLRAECEARLNNLTAAKADLEILRVRRMPAAEATVNIGTQEQMIRFVIDERKREYAFLGYRWFDMRRLSVDPIFANDVFTHKTYDMQGNIVSTLTLPKERLTLRLPLKIMAQNSNITNNP